MRVKADSIYEYERQPRLILAALRLLSVSTTFLREYYPILHPEHWRELELRWIIGVCKKAYEERQKAPMLPKLKAALEGDMEVKPEEKELILRVLRKLDEFFVDDELRAYVEQGFEGFITYRATLYAVHEAQEFIDDGELDRAVEVVQESQRIRRYKDDWIVLPDDAVQFFEWFDPDVLATTTLPIGLEKLDEKLKGGARKGELCVMVAPLGYGKSQFLVHVGATAIRKRKSVVHFTLENSAEETSARYLYNLLEIDSDRLQEMKADDPTFIDRFDAMQRYGGDLRIMLLDGSDTTCIDIDGYLCRLKEAGVHPDLVIVDYGDLMRAGHPTSRDAKKYEELQTVFQELRGLATKHDVVLWTASQANRRGLQGKRVLTEHIADSLGKAFTADIIISMSKQEKEKMGRDASQPEEDEEEGPDNGVRILHLLKLRRGGADNWYIPAVAYFSQARLKETNWEEVGDKAIASVTKARMPAVRRKQDDAVDE